MNTITLPSTLPSTLSYDYSRAAIIEAIHTGIQFCFNPYASKYTLRPIVSYYLALKHSKEESLGIPTVEEYLDIISLDACHSIINKDSEGSRAK